MLGDTELAAHLAARPVFVSAAIFEPFGLAVLEAAQAGCPLVLSDIPSFRELWDGAATFVTPGDEDGFVDAITRLLDQSDLRAERGRAAVARAARYTPAATATAMCGLFGQVLDRRAAA
jgi:glycosyltransferase involved in cell wall biosynthesis